MLSIFFNIYPIFLEFLNFSIMNRFFPFVLILLFMDFQNFTDSAILRIVPTLFFCLYVFLFSHHFGFKFPKFILTLLLVVVIVFIGIFITKRADVSFELKVFKGLELISFFSALIMYLDSEFRKYTMTLVFTRLVYWPLTVFVGINLFLFFLGIKGEEVGIGKAMILSNFGIEFDRVQFILTSGINSYGTVLGFLLTFSLFGIFFLQESRTLYFSGFFLSFVSLMFTDSRGPILYSFIAFGLVYVLRNRKSSPYWIWAIPLIGVFGPILILSLLSFLATTEFADVISRSSTDLSSGNARSIIWGISLSEFFDFKFNHIFGYGEYGHYAAGLSQQWGYIFGRLEGSDLMHPHNTLISVTLDYGYFGLVLFVFIQFYVIRTVAIIWTGFRIEAILLIIGLLYYNLVGIGETMFGFYYPNVLYIYILFLSIGYMLRLYINYYIVKN